VLGVGLGGGPGYGIGMLLGIVADIAAGSSLDILIDGSGLLATLKAAEAN